MPLWVGSRAWRRHLAPEWTPARAALADLIGAISGVIVLGELLGTVGMFRRYAADRCGTRGRPRIRVVVPARIARIGPIRAPNRRVLRRRSPDTGAGRRRRGGRGVVGVGGRAVVHLGRAGVGSGVGRGGGPGNGDSLWYHMPFAAAFAQSGWLSPLQYLNGEALVTYYPANTSVLHAVGLLTMGSDVLSLFVNLALGADRVARRWCIGERGGVGPACLAAVAVVLTIPVVVVSEAGTAKDDVLGLVGLLACTAFIIHSNGHPRAAPGARRRAYTRACGRFGDREQAHLRRAGLGPGRQPGGHHAVGLADLDDGALDRRRVRNRRLLVRAESPRGRQSASRSEHRRRPRASCRARPLPRWTTSARTSCTTSGAPARLERRVVSRPANRLRRRVAVIILIAATATVLGLVTLRGTGARRLSDQYTKMRRELIDPKKASLELRPGDPYNMKPTKPPTITGPWHGGTTVMCVTDKFGNVIAATPSGLSSTAGVAGRTGIIHGSRLSSLNTFAGTPNVIQHGKRPRITLSPTLLFHDNQPVMAISVAGGDQQDQAAIQVILNYVEFDMSPEEAFKAPRFSTTHFISSFGQDRASLGSLSVPNTLPEAVQADLRARGHVVTASRGGVGGVALIGIDPKTKQATGVGPAAGKME